jgi:NTP pyrophosphatase (non-canonical NTP hydrolase)
LEDLNSITSSIIQFAKERDWNQFHNSKDLSLAISIEASELNELFLWKANEDVDKNKLKDELADIFMFSILLAHKHQLDIPTIIKDKISKNKIKYPIDKSKGSAKKYNEL